MDSKSQRNGVQDELKRLREKHLAKNQRDKLKDVSSKPLTTPEEAKALLATMREAQHKREVSHQPPSNLSADGMEAWFRKQRQEAEEMKRREKEAAEILRNYRHTTPRAFSNGDDTSATTQTEDDTSATGSDEAGGSNFSFSGDKAMAVMKETHEEKKDSHEPQLLGDAAVQSGNAPRTELNVATEFPDAKQPAVLPDEDEVTVWRNFISSEPGARFPPEAGRYHLYCSYACPGSHRALIVRALKGLENVISVTYLHPVWRLTNPDDPDDKHRGWVFGNPGGEPFSNTIRKGGPFPAAYSNNEPDPNMNAFSIREVYEAAGDTSEKFTIPLLWDTQQNTIVNNESSDISYIFNSCFNTLAGNPDLDLYTEDDAVEKAKLSEVSEWLAPLMIHGVYRCGFAKTQWAYDRAINDLCGAFDRADDVLERQRFLTSEHTLTDADINLFVTLLRFDEVYAVYFKANARLVMLTPSLLNFCRDIYQMPGVAETCNMEQIKAHFFASHAEWNKYSVIPRGLGFMELLKLKPPQNNTAPAIAAASPLPASPSPRVAELPSSPAPTSPIDVASPIPTIRSEHKTTPTPPAASPGNVPAAVESISPSPAMVETANDEAISPSPAMVETVNDEASAVSPLKDVVSESAPIEVAPIALPSPVLPALTEEKTEDVEDEENDDVSRGVLQKETNSLASEDELPHEEADEEDVEAELEEIHEKAKAADANASGAAAKQEEEI